MRTRKRTIKRRNCNRDNKKTKKHLHRPRLSMKSKNKKKSRKKSNKKIKKTKRRKKYYKGKISGEGFLDGFWLSDPYGGEEIINEKPVLEEPVLVTERGDIIDEDTELRERLQAYFDNDLRNSMIRWKKEAKRKREEREEREPGWVNVSAQPEKLVDEDNYIKYLLDEIKENITNKKREGWKRADTVGLSKGAKAQLELPELKDEDGRNYWIDPRIIGSRWLGLFKNTSADDNIIEMEMPGI